MNTQQTLIEGKEAELSHNKLAKVQKVLNPLSDELKKQRADFYKYAFNQAWIHRLYYL